MYASSTREPNSKKWRIPAEKKQFDALRQMMVDYYVAGIKTKNGHDWNSRAAIKLIPGQYYYIDNMPRVRNYIDETNWILLHGKYVGPAAYLQGHEFSGLKYIYISKYNVPAPLSESMTLVERDCRFIRDPDQPSEAEISRNRKHAAQLRIDFDAMRAEPVDSPETKSGIYHWIGEDYRAARRRQTHQEHGVFAPHVSSSNRATIRTALPYTASAHNKRKNAQRKKSQRMKRSESLPLGGSRKQ